MSDAASGWQWTNDASDHYNAVMSVVDQAMSRVYTSTLVKVMAVRGGTGPVGSVDIMPMVHQVDGVGKTTPHGTIFNVPYMRAQGGNTAIIIDPQVGDIGWANFANRDISKVKATLDFAAPDSKRMHSPSDALYVGGTLNGTPQHIISFLNGQILISSTNKVSINAPDIEFTSSTLKHNGVNISSTHVHPDPQGGVTGTPQ